METRVTARHAVRRGTVAAQPEQHIVISPAQVLTPSPTLQTGVADRYYERLDDLMEAVDE
jgi:hypothetical protein